MNRLKEITATFFFTGYVPGAPGTAGAFLAALMCLPVFLFIPPPWRYAAIGMLALLALLGNAFSAEWAQARFGKSDPPQMVIDEALGMFISVLFMPGISPLIVLAGGFILFRIFDITKPLPVRRMERLPGWAGIAMDDLVAGILANLVLHTGFICYNAVVMVG